MDTATVYFLGAGASKDAGIPLTAGLLPRVKANIRDRSESRRPPALRPDV